VLTRKGLEYDRVELNEAVTAELIDRHGTAEPPLLEDGAHAVAGMRPIAFFLERTVEKPSIFPADAQKRNQAVTLAEFAEQAIGRQLSALRLAHGPRDEAIAELRALGLEPVLLTGDSEAAAREMHAHLAYLRGFYEQVWNRRG
jgi:glutathione S-transferase